MDDHDTDPQPGTPDKLGGEAGGGPVLPSNPDTRADSQPVTDGADGARHDGSDSPETASDPRAVRVPPPTEAGASPEADDQDDPLLGPLERWDVAYRRGQDPPPETLGVDDPTLLGALRERINRQKRLYAFMKFPPALAAMEAGPAADDARARAPGIATTTVGEDRDQGPVGTGPDSDPAFIGRYRVTRTLGQGAFGRVYLAHDPVLDRDVAIKVPVHREASRFLDLDAYLNEARILARLVHPNIVPVYDVVQAESGECYVVSKYMDGGDLAGLLRRGQPGYSESAALVVVLCDALHYTHTQDLFHRDIKPANILLDALGAPSLADFGLALKDENLGKGARYVGTSAYMSPEQARGEGHRVDGRSDIFSMGIVFYELLTGRRPFRGDSPREVMQQIVHSEPRPPRQMVDGIPRELERICLKALSKRSSERYTTARDLAEDLRHFLGAAERLPRAPAAVTAPMSPEAMPRPPSGPPEPTGRPIRIVPKGLGSFDEYDADFFLELLPGPRDRDELPDGLRFWKTRIDATDRDRTFRVGMIYGPSGCGKSSLVKAGLLPRLGGHVMSVYVEATAFDTEARLLRGIRDRFPELPGDAGLVASLTLLRRGHGLPPGSKALLVLDQFEQWLFARRGEQETELVAALRQCDGEHLQALFLVRDDFWMATTRFTRELEIDLVADRNVAAADLFDPKHARKVLAAYGTAYETLPQRHQDLTREQNAFLDQAVASLAQDGKVVPVRLALFAEMMKGKSWVPATLREVGGMEGVGVKFLEETFSSVRSNPNHRYHEKAAQAVLKALLPETNADIKGRMKSIHELKDVSGYESRPGDFADLLRILDKDLRLITPVDLERSIDGEAPSRPTGGPCYQLTHDYLVHSLRDWMTQKQRESTGGRVAIRLAERTAEWNARRSRRYLPSWWEWILILIFTRRSRRTPPERALVAAATRYHATRAGVVAAAVVLFALLAGQWLGAVRARAAVRVLESAETGNVPGLIEAMGPHRPWADPLLRGLIDDPQADPRRKARARLALLPVDASQAPALLARLLDGDPEEFLVIRDALCRHGPRPALARQCRELLRNERETPGHRLRAGMALAGLLGAPVAGDDAALRGSAQHLAGWFVDDLLTHPDRYDEWLAAMQPARAVLVPPLSQIFRDPNQGDGAASIAATTLSSFVADDAGTLTELLLVANVRQFPVILRALSRFEPDVSARLLDLLRRSPPAGADPREKYDFVHGQANAAIALFDWGHQDHLWPLLRHSQDPLLRTYLIDRAAVLTTDPSVLVSRLERERDVSVRRALIMLVGRIPNGQRSPSWAGQVVGRLLDLYRSDPDPGIHSAAEWSLREWKRANELDDADRQLAGVRASAGRSWYLTGTGRHTMATLRGPVTFRMGRGEQEPGRPDSDETAHMRELPRTFSIATKEVTVRQFLELRPSPELPNESSPERDCPANVIKWLEACIYCRLLSEKEHVPEEQMCYPKVAEIKEGMRPFPDYLSRTGYRLPTEAEMEYACRSGAVTSRFFGDDDEMLSRHAWFVKNSDGRTWPGGLLLPNDFGLFDVLGNVKEWCWDSYRRIQRDGPDREDEAVVSSGGLRVARGGAFNERARVLRAANRYFNRPDYESFGIGFRVARTEPAPE